MDKNLIKKHLSNFLKEEKDGIPKVTKDALAKNKKINDDGVKAIGKDVTVIDKSMKKADEKMPENKFNYVNKDAETYHSEMEIMNGQEMIQYDRIPSERFTERALEAIEGSSNMGNNPEWANVVAKGQGGDPEFGKNLVKKVKDSVERRNKQTPTLNLRGRDIQADIKDYGNKPYAFENEEKKTAKVKDTEEKPKNDGEDYEKISREVEYGVNPYSDEMNEAEIEKGKFTKWCKSHGFEGPSISCAKKAMSDKYESSTHKMATFYMNTVQPKGKTTKDLEENKNNPKIKESMKRLRFKKEFNGVGNALKLIPENYKVDNKVFEMTDGNETYKIRWEGNINEGKAVVLLASDKQMVNEDIQKMKHLMGYKSQDTLGLMKGKSRIDENVKFADIYAKTKSLLEGEDIEDQDAEKEANWDEAGIKQAPEAKKHVEGSASTEKGTKAPSPKTGHWEDNVKGEAPEAKKHVTLKENIYEDDMYEGGMYEEGMYEGDDYYDATSEMGEYGVEEGIFGFGKGDEKRKEKATQFDQVNAKLVGTKGDQTHNKEKWLDRAKQQDNYQGQFKIDRGILVYDAKKSIMPSTGGSSGFGTAQGE